MVDGGLSKAKPRLFKRGGNRVTSGASKALSAPQIEAIWAGGKRAMSLDMPLNRFVTVHWQALGICDHQASQATQGLIRRARDWVRDRGIGFASVWVRENDLGDGAKGSHVHWLVHVPQRHESAFVGAVRRFVRHEAGVAILKAKSVKNISIGKVGAWRGDVGSYQLNLTHVLAYVTKQCEPTDSAISQIHAQELFTGFDVGRMPKSECGRVIGKRAGVSRLLIGKVHPI